MTPKNGVRPRAITQRNRDRFLALLASACSISHAAREAGFSRKSWYALRQRDEGFAASWDDAIEEGADLLEDEARRRAVEGVEQPVYHGGEMVGTMRKYSDTLLMFLLNGRRPERYCQRASTEHTGKSGGPIELVTIDQIDGEIARLSQLLGGD